MLRVELGYEPRDAGYYYLRVFDHLYYDITGKSLEQTMILMRQLPCGDGRGHAGEPDLGLPVNTRSASSGCRSGRIPRITAWIRPSGSMTKVVRSAHANTGPSSLMLLKTP